MSIRGYDCKIKLKCMIGDSKVTLNINADLELDDAKPLAQIEDDIINDIRNQYDVGEVIDHTIQFHRRKR